MSDRIKITRDQVKAVENAMRKGTTDQAVPIEHGGKTWQVPVTRVSQALAEHHEHGSASLRLRVRSFQIELEDGAVRAALSSSTASLVETVANTRNAEKGGTTTCAVATLAAAINLRVARSEGADLWVWRHPEDGPEERSTARSSTGACDTSTRARW